MYFSFFVSKHFVPILALVATQVHICSGESFNNTNEYLTHKCYINQGKYKPGSKYEKILKPMLRGVSLEDFRTGYENPRKNGPQGSFLSVLVQCRGDTYGPNCRSCFKTALATFQKECPSYKGGIIWYDECLLEISTINTIGKVVLNNTFCMSNSKNVTGDPSAFTITWVTLIDHLTTIATSKGNKVHGMLKPYAAGLSRFGKEKMYGMVQCTEDISNKDCKECVSNNIVKFQECWRNQRGGGTSGRSCSFRFEFFPFLKDDTEYI